MEVARAGAEKKEVYRAKALVEEEAIKGAEETAAAVEPAIIAPFLYSVMGRAVGG